MQANLIIVPEAQTDVEHEQYRRALVRRFPYSVFYEYTLQSVIVYSIFHTSQKPEKWFRRLM